jgi:hypothetical protein
MRRFLQAFAIHAGAIALAFSAASQPVSAAGGLVALSHLASELGYNYTWIGSESAVALTRPGVYILVRAGNQLYDVNDAVESTDSSPQYRDNDIYVGPALVTRLRGLAVKYAPDAERMSPPDAPPGTPGAMVHGALTVAANPTNVSDAVVVSGSGPANEPLTITLWADIARDIPRVLLSRTNTATDASGHFSVAISTAPLIWQKSTLVVSAASVPGVTEAHTSFLLGQPSPKIAHPVDELPRDFRPH